MKIRRVLKLSAFGMSLLYGAGVCLLWVRSYSIADELEINLGVHKSPTHIELSSGNGIVHFDLNYWVSQSGSATVRHRSYPIDRAMLGDQLQMLGYPGGEMNIRFVTPFCWYSGQHSSGQVWCNANSRHWLLLVPPAPFWLWLIYLRLMRSAHRRRQGLCVSCGYNLTGNVSGHCPECGKAVLSR